MSKTENFTAGIEFNLIDIPTLIKVKRLISNSRKELGTDYENANRIISKILSYADKKKVNQYESKLNAQTLIHDSL